MDTGFATIIEQVASAVPGRTAISTPVRAFSYREFDERAARLATVFRQAGLGEGDKVACYLYNVPAYLETVFAAMKIGAVPVNANYRYTGGELAALLNDADAKALVFSDSLADNVVGITGQVPTLALVLRAGGSAEHDEFERAIASASPHPREERPGTDQLFMYTGGTTGRPKGVIWRQRDLLHSLAVPVYQPVGVELPSTLDEAVKAAILAGDDRLPVTMPAVPLMHGTGFFNTLGTMLLGGHVVLAGGTRLDPAAVWRQVGAQRVKTIIIAGNAVATPLLDELDRLRSQGLSYDLSSLTHVLTSGTALSDGLKRRLHEAADLTITDAIGSSEGGPFAFAITTSADDLPSRFLPIPSTKVFDDDDAEVEPGSGRAGMLAYSGPSPLGYYKDSAKTATTFRTIKGVRYSIPGDRVMVNMDGSVRFLGRDSGVINSGGEKVHPQEVEEVLLEHPAVRDCVVVGTPDETWGEKVAAVVATGSQAVRDEELRDWVRTRLAGYKVPRTIVMVPELPRTPTGKIEVAWAKERVRE
ncbi:AMP-binding protein [Microbispora sp. H10836]|uniref:AMP-binding protein n=1 Tax=Microbispora sp. H10836 TaxID=2729106 RepID=UPI0014758873|nr:AMP-binding protein [Microbispora sp. H10836]